MTPALKNYLPQCREQTTAGKNRRAEVLPKLIAAADSQQTLVRVRVKCDLVTVGGSARSSAPGICEKTKSIGGWP